MQAPPARSAAASLSRPASGEGRNRSLLGGLHLFATNRSNVAACRELTKAEPGLERCDDTRTAHDGQLKPPVCGTIDTDSNAASHSKSTMDGRAAAAEETLSSTFDPTTSKAQDESQKVSQFDSDAITP